MVKFEGKIEIDLALIFCINQFFGAILSFWDMIDFVFFFCSTKQKFEEKKYILGGGLGPQAPAAFELTP